MRIKRELLGKIYEMAKSAHPEEFGALLREREGIIDEILFYPRHRTYRGGVLIYTYEIPLGLDFCGTVHSHPSGSCHPSKADLDVFGRYGRVHMIIPYPYDRFCAYDSRGKPVELEVV